MSLLPAIFGKSKALEAPKPLRKATKEDIAAFMEAFERAAKLEPEFLNSAVEDTKAYLAQGKTFSRLVPKDWTEKNDNLAKGELVDKLRHSLETFATTSYLGLHFVQSDCTIEEEKNEYLVRYLVGPGVNFMAPRFSHQAVYRMDDPLSFVFSKGYTERMRTEKYDPAVLHVDVAKKLIEDGFDLAEYFSEDIGELDQQEFFDAIEGIKWSDERRRIEAKMAKIIDQRVEEKVRKEVGRQVQRIIDSITVPRPPGR